MTSNLMLERRLCGLEEVELILRQLVLLANEADKRVVTDLRAPLGHLGLTRERGTGRSRELGLVVHLLLMRLVTTHCSRKVDSSLEDFVVPTALVKALTGAKVERVQRRTRHIWCGLDLAGSLVDSRFRRGIVSAVVGVLAVCARRRARRGKNDNGNGEKKSSDRLRHNETVAVAPGVVLVTSDPRVVA